MGIANTIHQNEDFFFKKKNLFFLVLIYFENFNNSLCRMEKNCKLHYVCILCPYLLLSLFPSGNTKIQRSGENG